MVPTPPPSVPEVSTIPLPQTDSIAPRPLLRCIGPSQHLGNLSGRCGTIWMYAVAEQHAWSGQQEKGVRSLMCLCCLLSVFNYASGDNCCGISWATTAISLQGWHTEEAYWVASFSQRGCDTCLLTRWRHGLPLSGGCQLPQQALPPHLLLITAGGYAPAEWLLMLKRSPGSKISGLPSSTIALPEGSFLAGLDRGTVTLHGYGSGKMFVLSGEETALDGTPQESAARTQSTWLKWPLWFKQSLALSPENWTLSSSLSVLKWQFPLLAGNCFPYHQPCLYSLRPKSVLEPTWFYAQYDRECWSLLYKRFAARRRRPNTWRDSPTIWCLDASRLAQVATRVLFLKWTGRCCIFVDSIGVAL